MSQEVKRSKEEKKKKGESLELDLSGVPVKRKKKVRKSSYLSKSDSPRKSC